MCHASTLSRPTRVGPLVHGLYKVLIIFLVLELEYRYKREGRTLGLEQRQLSRPIAAYREGFGWDNLSRIDRMDN